MCIIYAEHSGLGNMVMATPLLRNLRLAYPEQRIYVSCWDRSLPVIKHLSCIDGAFSVHPAQVINAMRQRGELPIYLLVSPVGSLVDDYTESLADFTIKAPVNAPWLHHESQYKMALLNSLCEILDPKDNLPELISMRPEVAMIEDYQWSFMGLHEIRNTPYIVVNASFLKSDHWYRKHWGNANYSRFIDLYCEQNPGVKVVMVGLHPDIPDAEAIKEGCHAKDNVQILCGETDFDQICTLLKNAQLVFGNDSGLAHVAAALGTLTYTIFTFTSITKNRPIGINSHVLAVKCEDRTGCQHGHWKNCSHKNCMNLSPEQVMEAIRGTQKKTTTPVPRA